MTNLDSILKSRDVILPTKTLLCHLVKAMVFPVVLYRCESWTIKKIECQKNRCFWTVMLEKTLESSLDCKEIQPVHPKAEYWLEGLILKLQCFGYRIRRADSLEKILMLGKIEGRRRGGQTEDRGWDGWMASRMQWTWIWASSGSWWWTGNPGVLQSMGSQRVRYD